MSQPTTTYVAGLARSAVWPWRVIGALTMLALLGAVGNAWDLFWHIVIGRDSFWIPPHTMMYAAVALSGLIALASVAILYGIPEFNGYSKVPMPDLLSHW